MASNPVEFEAAPDVQVSLIIMKDKVVTEILEANINISRTTSELKQSLSGPLQIPVDNMELWKDDVELQNEVSLMEYEITPDDNLIVKDMTPENDRTA